MSGIKGYTVEEVARIAKEKLISDYEFCKGNLAKIRQREKEIADIRLDYNSKIARYRIESVDRVLDFIRSEYKAGRDCRGLLRDSISRQSVSERDIRIGKSRLTFLRMNVDLNIR